MITGSDVSEPQELQSSVHRDHDNNDDFPVNVNHSTSREAQQKQWSLNYHEAAIYIQEGENNDKFTTHPKSQESLPAYLLAHNTLFYLLDLVAALMLLSLALIERPAVHGLDASVWVRGI